MDHGKVLATRASGREAADHLRAVAETPGDLIVDFSSVEVVTPPFLQELVEAVYDAIQRQQDRGRIVVAVNMNDDVLETLSFVLGRRKSAIPHRRGNEVELLEAAPHLVETLREAQQLRSFTAPQLAERLQINDDAATHRLKKLLEIGAVARQRDPDATQGVRHVYRAATSDLLTAAT